MGTALLRPRASGLDRAEVSTATFEKAVVPAN
jgi:hypothetical protein